MLYIHNSTKQSIRSCVMGARYLSFAAVFLLLGFAALSSAEEELNGEILISASILHTFEGVEIEVWTSDEEASPEMEMEEVVLKYRSVDSETWTAPRRRPHPEEILKTQVALTIQDLLESAL